MQTSTLVQKSTTQIKGFFSGWVMARTVRLVTFFAVIFADFVVGIFTSVYLLPIGLIFLATSPFFSNTKFTDNATVTVFIVCFVAMMLMSLGGVFYVFRGIWWCRVKVLEWFESLSTNSIN